MGCGSSRPPGDVAATTAAQPQPPKLQQPEPQRQKEAQNTNAAAAMPTPPQAETQPQQEQKHEPSPSPQQQQQQHGVVDEPAPPPQQQKDQDQPQAQSLSHQPATGQPLAAAAVRQQPQQQQQQQQEEEQGGPQPAAGAFPPPSALVEEEEQLLMLLQKQQEQQLQMLHQPQSSELGQAAGSGGGGGSGDPDQDARFQQQQAEVQKRLDGLAPEQIQVLKGKLQQRLEKQVAEFTSRMKQQEEERLREEAEAERREAERSERKQQAAEARPQRQQQYEQELLQTLLGPTMKLSAPASDMNDAADAAVAAADGQASRPPLPTITVKAWTGDSGDDGLLFPEADDLDFKIGGFSRRAPLALCMGGGGFSAAMLGLGWLRALHEMKLLTKAQYLCTCSGSAWLAPLSFQPLEALADFLGPCLAPEACSPEALSQIGAKGRSYTAALVAAAPALAALQSQLSGRIAPDELAAAWSKGVAEAFLEPFGLSHSGTNSDSAVTISGTKGDVHESVAVRAATLGRTLHTANGLLPFPIICQSVLLPEDPVLFYPYEWTPMYGGCPVSYGNTQPKLGGGWVESLGVNAELVSKPATAGATGCEVRVRPAGPSSIAEAIATSSLAAASSSNAPADGDSGYITAAYVDQQSWNSTRELAFTDGGGAAHTAMFPALRRRVKNIMSFTAARTAISDKEEFCASSKELPALFGRWPGDSDSGAGPSPQDYNKQCQVFPSEAFDALYDALLAKVEAGEPAVHVAEYEVMANAHAGIPGGWTVRVMWVLNQVQGRWEAVLPQPTRDQLQASRRATGFPFPSALPPASIAATMVQMMSNHAAWMLLQNRELVHSLFEDCDDDDDE